MVSEMPCKVVGGPSDHEPDPVQESSDHSQREDLPDASRQVHHAMDDATKRHASHSTQECTIGTRLPNPNTVSGIPDVLTGIEDSSHAIVASHELVGESTKQPHGHSSEASTNGNEVPMWRASNSTASEEIRPHSRQIVLEVCTPGVRLLRVGSGGDSPDARGSDEEGRGREGRTVRV